MCYYMSYLPLYHLVLFIEIDFYVLLHELSPIIPLVLFIEIDFYVLLHELSAIICELKRALYGIKCVLRIF
jgi:hypothetical protein